MQKKLQQLEQVLKTVQLWQETSPSPAELSSTLPFCLDTLTLSQWLQFIFIPRVQHLLDQQLPIPAMAITPYAEQVLPAHNRDYSLLLQQLRDIDGIG